MGNKITVRVFRFDPSMDQSPRYETHEVDVEENARVISVLEKLKDETGLEFAFRESCTIARCGTCGVRVNGKPKLACWEPAETEMIIEPIENFPVIRDLVVDRSRYYRHLKDIEPVLERGKEYEGFPESLTDKDFTERGDTLYNCIECMLCMSACPAFRNDKEFHGPATLWRAYVLINDPRDSKKIERLDRITTSVLWRCSHCYECTKVCPAEVDPGSAIVSLKELVLKKTKTNEAKWRQFPAAKPR